MLRHTALSAALALGLAPAVHAQSPEVPLTIIVPYPAGGPLDTSAHILADGARSQLGEIKVENQPGAGGSTGADLVAKSAPGNNRLVMGAVATHAVNPWLSRSFPYDALKDFTPLVLVARLPNVLVMNAEQARRLGIDSTAALVQYLKKNPEQLKYGSGGNGSIGHIAGEMFKSLTNTRMPSVHFQGSTPALAALASGQVDLVFDNLASSLPQIQDGRLKALGVTTLGASAVLPGVPSINDAVPGFNVSTWFGLFAPATLPAAEARRYAAAFTQVMQSPQHQAQFAKMGFVPEKLTLDGFRSFVQSENSKYGFLIKAVKIRTE